MRQTTCFLLKQRNCFVHSAAIWKSWPLGRTLFVRGRIVFLGSALHGMPLCHLTDFGPGPQILQALIFVIAFIFKYHHKHQEVS